MLLAIYKKEHNSANDDDYPQKQLLAIADFKSLQEAEQWTKSNSWDVNTTYANIGITYSASTIIPTDINKIIPEIDIQRKNSLLSKYMPQNIIAINTDNIDLDEMDSLFNFLEGELSNSF